MSSKEGFLAVSLILIAMGAGGIKANVSPMGADQLEQGRREMVQKFFYWFYWFIQVGALFAYTIVVYVQQAKNFFYGYLITVISIVLATIFLIIGRNYYTVHPPHGSYLADTFRIIGRGLRKKLCCRRSPALTHWLDGAKTSNGGEYSEDMVEGVKSLVGLMPIFLTFIFYWTIFGQVIHTVERAISSGLLKSH